MSVRTQFNKHTVLAECTLWLWVWIPPATQMLHVYTSSEQITLRVVTLSQPHMRGFPWKLTSNLESREFSGLTGLKESERKHYGVCVCVLPWKWEDIFGQNTGGQRTTLYDRMLSCFHKTLVNTIVSLAWRHLILQVKNLVVKIDWQPCPFGWKSFQR